jgi:hypothetical protein
LQLTKKNYISVFALQVFLTSAEFFLVLTMIGYSEEDKLIQEYAEVAKSTKKNSGAIDRMS